MEKNLVFVESNSTGSGTAFLEKAAALGLQPHLICVDPAFYPNVPAGTCITRVETSSDPVALTEIARSLQPAGILTTSSYYLHSTALLAARLGLPGQNPDALAACLDKYRQRLRLEARGVSQPRFRRCSTVAEAVNAAADLDFPVILKPVEGSGKTGVALVNDEGELRTWAELLAGRKNNERGLPVASGFLVEEYFVGREFSIECFHGEPIAVCEKRCQAPRFVEESHLTPPVDLSVAAIQSLYRLVMNAVLALDVSWGPAHVEVRRDERGEMVIIEVNPRLAGGNIPLLVAESTGIDLIGATIQASLGETAPLVPLRRRAAAIAFAFAQQEGCQPVVTGLEAAGQKPGVVLAQAYSQYSRTDEIIRLHGDFRDRFAYAVTTGLDAAETLAQATAAAEAIRLEVQPCS